MSEPRASESHGFIPVRAVEVPDAPFEGVLARAPGGGSVHLVDRATLADWPGWDRAAHDHVLGVLDVVRRTDGHDVVFPVLSERLDRLLARRVDTAPLADGEAVTVAVSVVRGLSAVLADPRDASCAQWWLDDDGRPLLVEGRGDDDARRASAAVLRDTAQVAGERMRPVLEELADDIADERRRGLAIERLEEPLFACAAPEPLATDVLGVHRRRAPEAVVPQEETGHAREPWVRTLAAHIDTDLADTVSDALARVRRRFTARRGRRAPLLVEAALAGVVLVAGLLWPDTSGDAVPAAPERGTDHPAEETASTARTTPAPSSSPTTPEEVLAALLDERRSCTEPRCHAAIVESPDRELGPGAIDVDPGARVIRFVDDLGGLAVLRVETPDGSATAQVVTIVDTAEGWRIRDAYAVADPPP